MIGDIFTVIFIAIFSYVIGSLPTAYLLTRFIGRKNIFEIGSGNMGGTNVARAMGLHWGIITGIIDVFKGMVPVYLAQLMLPDNVLVAAIVAAIFAVAGHNWSLFATGIVFNQQHIFQIRGGKGAATAFGTMLMILPPTPIIILLVIAIGLAIITRYASLSVLVSFAVAMSWTIVWALQNNKMLLVPYVLAIAVLMLFRFRENIERLIAGNERRIGEPAQ